MNGNAASTVSDVEIGTDGTDQAVYRIPLAAAPTPESCGWEVPKDSVRDNNSQCPPMQKDRLVWIRDNLEPKFEYP